MSRRIVIDPVTRIEGHAKITIHLDEAGAVQSARFHVTEFRGFEKFCVGRPFWEMPGLTSRICGICPVSHLLVSAKAGDAILGVAPPPAAVRLRRLCNLAQIIQSHAMSYFHLSSPDLLFGMDSPPAERNLFGVMAKEPEFARGGIRLRQFGQQVIEKLGGRKIHPAWAVAGGVKSGLSADGQSEILASIPEVKRIAQNAIGRFKDLLDKFQAEVESFGNFDSLFLSLVRPEDGGWEHYDGVLRLVDASGAVVVDSLEPKDYRSILEEAVESDSYLKSPFYKPLGPSGGCYRVGPLARLNVCSQMGVDAADQELAEYRQRGGRIVRSSFYYHYARLIEILGCIEWMQRALEEESGGDEALQADAGVNHRQGVGCGEAPRGVLFHEYHVDANGILDFVNLLIATGQNNIAMNRTVEQIARRFVRGSVIPEGALNRVEAGIRAFDPCLSCSTHAMGSMPMIVQLVRPDGSVAAERRRSSP